MFSLCRPPGHHASADIYGGYCCLNNAAIAAQAFRDDGAERVAILDIDCHHGNGTQTKFYDRDDVLFASLHGHPQQEFPNFLGYEEETGAGAALDQACARIADYGPDALVVSLGDDTFEGDPISEFKLQSEDYLKIGARIAALARPTLFVMEGGYAVAEIGVNTVNVLGGQGGSSAALRAFGRRLPDIPHRAARRA